MSYSIPSFNKILPLTTAPFLVPSLSANLPWCQECIFYCAPRKKRNTLPPEGTDINIQQHNHRKDLNPCLSLYYYGKVIVELENTQTRNLTVFMVFVIWPSSTLKFLFAFDSVNVYAIFSLRDCQQITFIMLNRFCSLSKLSPPPLSLLMNKTKLDGIPSKIKWKMHVFWYIVFQVLKLLLIKKIKWS